MTKREFLDRLEQGLSGMPKNEIAGRLAFYDEMIDDYMEEGMTEQEAVAKIGSVEEITAEIIADIPFTKLLKEKFKAKGKIKGWEIVLIVLGFPIWFSLLVGTFAIVVSLYAALWSIVVSLWACFGAFVGAAVGGTLGGILFACTGNPIAGFSILGGGIASAGLAIFAFYGCKGLSKGVLWLTKNIVVGAKKCFVKKEKI